MNAFKIDKGYKIRAIVNIYLKDGVLDPQGKATHHALAALGFKNVEDVRIGKQIILNLDSKNIEDSQDEVEKMTQTLLANTVIEDYTIEIMK